MNTSKKTQEELVMPRCAFCGQAIIADREFIDSKDAEHYATMHCKCKGAQSYQEKERMKEERRRAEQALRDGIDALARFCESKGHFLHEDSRKMLFSVGLEVVKGHIDSVSVKLGSIKVSVKLDSDGKLFFKKNYTETDSVRVL